MAPVLWRFASLLPLLRPTLSDVIDTVGCNVDNEEAEGNDGGKCVHDVMESASCKLYR
jgi:hypothetical protein